MNPLPLFAVIQPGRQIGYSANWKGRGYESYIFAAPVVVGDTTVFVAAVVDKNPSGKFYLSEMVDSEGNYVRIEESPSGNAKNGVTDGAGSSDEAGITAGPEGLSEGGDLSAQNAEPTPHFKSSIPRESGEVKQITDESILYLGENKNETDSWFQAQGQRVPMRGTIYGFIRSIAHPMGKVNAVSRTLTREELVDGAGGGYIQGEFSLFLLTEMGKSAIISQFMKCGQILASSAG